MNDALLSDLRHREAELLKELKEVRDAISKFVANERELRIRDRPVPTLINSGVPVLCPHKPRSLRIRPTKASPLVTCSSCGSKTRATVDECDFCSATLKQSISSSG